MCRIPSQRVRNGLISHKQDAKGQRITYEYDTKNRLKVVRKYPVGWAQDDPSQKVTYHYDSNPFDPASGDGGVWVAFLGAFRESYTYHPAGAMTMKRMDQLWHDENNNNALKGWKLESAYTYDNEGRLSTITYPDPGVDSDVHVRWLWKSVQETGHRTGGGV